MAQLKDLIVNGTSRLIGDAFTNKITISTLADSTDSTGSNGQVLQTNGASISWATLGGAASKGVTDKSTATAIGSSDTNLITARAVYYGLPSINGAHNYTSSTSIYAPTSTGTNGQFLKTTGSGAPSWASLPVATTSVTGIVQLNSTTNSDSTTQAATPSAVKAAYNLANSYKGTVTSITLSAGPGIALDATGAITGSGTRTISLATIDSSDTTSTASPSHGGTFSTIGGITVDTYGRVTGIDTQTVTLPADSNTHYTTHLYINTTSGGTKSNVATTNTNTYMHLYDDSTKRDTVQFKGAGGITITSTNAKVVTITGTTYSGSNGISLSGTTFSNSGVRTVEASTTNLNFKVNTNGTTDSIAIPTGKLTLFGQKEYNGSEDVEIHASDVGLAGAMTFRGKITSELSEGSTSQVTLEGTTGNMTRNTGDVVLDTASKEYVWDGSKWIALGLAADFALKTHVHGNIKSNGTVTATASVASGMKLLLTNSSSQVIASGISFGSSANYALSNKGTWIAVNNYSLPNASPTTKGGIKVGTGLTMSGEVLNHSNSITSGTVGTTASTSGTTLNVPYITFDGQGHITGSGTHEHTITAAQGNARIYYGTCPTASATYAKAVTCADYGNLQVGDVVLVKFTYTNSATANASLTLNVNGTGAKPIKKIYNTVGNSDLAHKSELTAAGIHEFMYDGTNWVLTNGDYNSTYTISSVWCGTASATTAKVSSNAAYYVLRAGNIFEVTTRYANTVKGAITFNVNGTGAKPIYINGVATSSSNYTLPAGKYLVYYDGTKYDFFTNGGARFGSIYTTSASYGETLPASGSPGQLFFQTSSGGMYELPAGGSAGQVLVKNSASDRDVSWASAVTNATNAYTSASTVKAYVVGSTVNSSSFKSLVHNASVYTQGSVLFGAAWNDYAEFRKDNQNEIQEPGRCVTEQGDGSLVLTTQRLQRGCEIISDTFGFAIGQDEGNGYNTPIAVSGRVLAYIYEGKEIASQHIGWPVCSGPDGTVSIMTEEEEEKYPSRIIGTISEIPEYEYWGAKSIEVKERVWIRIK